MQHNLIWELMLSEFELGHNAMEAIKNIFYKKGEGAVDHNRVTRGSKKFNLGCKDLDDQAKSDRPKSMDSKVILQARRENLTSSSW